PAVSTSWTCTKTSGPPSSGRMKPNPRSVLKNFTPPVGMTHCKRPDKFSRPRLPELGISQSPPSHPQPDHRSTRAGPQGNGQNVGKSPQPPQNGAQFLVLLAGRREQ